jgi:hypothetical protein
LRVQAERLESDARRATAERAAPPKEGEGPAYVSESEAGRVERYALKGYWLTPRKDTTNPATGERIPAGKRVWVPSINPPRANDLLYARARKLRAEAERLESEGGALRARANGAGPQHRQ